MLSEFVDAVLDLHARYGIGDETTEIRLGAEAEEGVVFDLAQRPDGRWIVTSITLDPACVTAANLAASVLGRPFSEFPLPPAKLVYLHVYQALVVALRRQTEPALSDEHVAERMQAAYLEYRRQRRVAADVGAGDGFDRWLGLLDPGVASSGGRRSWTPILGYGFVLAGADPPHDPTHPAFVAHRVVLEALGRRGRDPLTGWLHVGKAIKFDHALGLSTELWDRLFELLDAHRSLVRSRKVLADRVAELGVAERDIAEKGPWAAFEQWFDGQRQAVAAALDDLGPDPETEPREALEGWLDEFDRMREALDVSRARWTAMAEAVGRQRKQVFELAARDLLNKPGTADAELSERGLRQRRAAGDLGRRREPCRVPEPAGSGRSDRHRHRVATARRVRPDVAVTGPPTRRRCRIIRRPARARRRRPGSRRSGSRGGRTCPVLPGVAAAPRRNRNRDSAIRQSARTAGRGRGAEPIGFRACWTTSSMRRTSGIPELLNLALQWRIVDADVRNAQDRLWQVREENLRSAEAGSEPDIAAEALRRRDEAAVLDDELCALGARLEPPASVRGRAASDSSTWRSCKSACAGRLPAAVRLRPIHRCASRRIADVESGNLSRLDWSTIPPTTISWCPSSSADGPSQSELDRRLAAYAMTLYPDAPTEVSQTHSRPGWHSTSGRRGVFPEYRPTRRVCADLVQTRRATAAAVRRWWFAHRRRAGTFWRRVAEVDELRRMVEAEPDPPIVGLTRLRLAVMREYGDIFRHVDGIPNRVRRMWNQLTSTRASVPKLWTPRSRRSWRRRRPRSLIVINRETSDVEMRYGDPHARVVVRDRNGPPG